MRLLNSLQLRKYSAFVVVLGCVLSSMPLQSIYKTPYVVCQRLLCIENLDEFSDALKKVVDEIRAITHTPSKVKKTELYTALLVDYQQYHLFFTKLMVHPKNKKIVYVASHAAELTHELRALKQNGYIPFWRWAKETSYGVYNDFYISYVTILAYLICSLFHDIPIASPMDYSSLIMQAKQLVRCLRHTFYYIKHTPYGQQYNHITGDYLELLKQAQKIAQQGIV